MNYPQYRKYKNNKSYFKISSAETFEEIRATGNKYFLYQFTAKILPDRNFISDMLKNHEGNWEIITELEYSTVKINHV
ncbi:MAG: hypothetical protein JNL63_08400 [Bacteroidia bacterium]|nr:hypothetical protein [Bacteroidia bacterium]